MARTWVILGQIVSGGVLVAIAWLLSGAWSLDVAIPSTLPPVDPTVDLGALSIESLELVDGERDVSRHTLSEFRGKRLFLFVVDERGAMAMSGFRLRNALMRWEYPDSVTGIEVASCGSMPTFAAGMIDRMMGMMREGNRFPVYVDRTGEVAASFRLVAGHSGLVILSERGDVLFRLSGEPSRLQLRQIRDLLRATDRPELPVAPKLPSLEPLLNDRQPAVIVFLGRTVRQSDYSGLALLQLERWMNEPSLRLVDHLRARWRLPADLDVVVVGDLRGFADRDWKRLPDGHALRRELHAPPDEAGILVLSRDRRVVLQAWGSVPLWKLAVAAEEVDIDPIPMFGSG